MIEDDIKSALNDTAKAPWRYEYLRGYCGEIIAANGRVVCTFTDEPSDDDAKILAGAPELLTRALSEIESLRAELAESQREMNLAKLGEFAAQSASGHLGTLVDDLRQTLSDAMYTMVTVETKGKPIDEPNGDFDCRIPYADWERFVNERAALLFTLHQSPHELPVALRAERDAAVADARRLKRLIQMEASLCDENRVCYYLRNLNELDRLIKLDAIAKGEAP